MRLDPNEPAYPWNLASMLNRLALNDLAVGYMTRAIQLAQRVGDEEWAGPDAHLALADVALDAGEDDLAVIAVARARQLAPGEDGVDRQASRLLRRVRQEGGKRPQVSLAVRLVESLKG